MKQFSKSCKKYKPNIIIIHRLKELQSLSNIYHEILHTILNLLGKIFFRQ